MLYQASRHYTGEEWIDLPAVSVFDFPEYEFEVKRVLPSVVIQNATGQETALSFDQELGCFVDSAGKYGDDTRQTYQVYGGTSQFTVVLSCGANQQDLQQRLTDVVAIYLLLGRFAAFFSTRTILLDQIVFLGENRMQAEPDQELVFEGRLSVRITADWRMVYPIDVIQRIDVDPELTPELFSWETTNRESTE